jgi:hypothetical protein
MTYMRTIRKDGAGDLLAEIIPQLESLKKRYYPRDGYTIIEESELLVSIKALSHAFSRSWIHKMPAVHLDKTTQMKVYFRLTECGQAATHVFSKVMPPEAFYR